MNDSQGSERAFGALLTQAREKAGLKIREAARRAAISEGTWRQLEKGYKSVGQGLTVPTNPRPSNVKAAAQAVGLDVVAALEAAGHHHEAEQERALQQRQPALSVVPATVEPLPADEEDNEVLAAIRRDPRLSPRNKAHFLNQYELLRDLSALEGARVTAPEEPLPYVAHGQRTTPVDPEEEQRLEEIARDARRRNHDNDDEQVPPQ